jgi:hypothetical protein
MRYLVIAGILINVLDGRLGHGTVSADTTPLDDRNGFIFPLAFNDIRLLNAGLLAAAVATFEFILRFAGGHGSDLCLRVADDIN